MAERHDVSIPALCFLLLPPSCTAADGCPRLPPQYLQGSKPSRSERSRERSRRTQAESSRGSKRSKERDRSRSRRRREEGVPHEDRWQPAGDAPQAAPEAAAPEPVATAVAREAAEQQPHSDSKSGDARCASCWVTGPGALPEITCHYLFPVDPPLSSAKYKSAVPASCGCWGFLQQGHVSAGHPRVLLGFVAARGVVGW